MTYGRLPSTGRRTEEQATRVAYLVSGFLRHTLTPTEHRELDLWIESSGDNLLLFSDLIDQRHIEEGLYLQEGIKTSKALKRIKRRIRFVEEGVQQVGLKRWIYGIAASIFILLGFMIFLGFYLQRLMDEAETAQYMGQSAYPVQRIDAGTNQATLTLSDGRQINLDTVATGIFSGEVAAQLNKSGDGELQVSSIGITGEMKYNVLATPKGGQYKIRLPDGTIAFLNAATTLRYPVSFGSDRTVELTGEAYFEVVKDAARPFIVRLKDQAFVEVKGTQFNVTAYPEEGAVTTTLLEGRVVMHSSRSSATLVPGEQAALFGGRELVTTKVRDAHDASAWKDGLFKFRDATIDEIMLQVGRWYNVSIEYQQLPRSHFNATIPRSAPVTRLLEILQQTNNVHFTVKGRKILVRE